MGVALHTAVAMTHLLLAVALVLPQSGASSEVAPPSGPRLAGAPLALRHLSIQMDLDYARRTISAQARLTLTNEGDSAVSTVPLQLGRLLSARAATDASGRSLPFRQDVVRFDDFLRYN